MRIDKDHTGTIDRYKLEDMAKLTMSNHREIDWNSIIEECDQTGDGQIDFQEFLSACISRRALTN